MAAQEALDLLPNTQHASALKMIAEPGVPPETAIKLLENIAAMPAKDRRRTFELYRSDDPQERSLAKSRAANLPPIPPASLTILRESIKVARRALKAETSAVNVDRIEAGIAALSEALEANERAYQQLRDTEGWKRTS